MNYQKHINNLCFYKSAISSHSSRKHLIFVKILARRKRSRTGVNCENMSGRIANEVAEEALQSIIERNF